MSTVLAQSYLLLTEETKDTKSSLNGLKMCNGTPNQNGSVNCHGTTTQNTIHRENKSFNGSLSNGRVESTVGVPSDASNRLTEAEEDSYVKVTRNDEEIVQDIQPSTSDTMENIPIIYKWDNIIAVSLLHVLAVYGIGVMAWNWSTLTILFCK